MTDTDRLLVWLRETLDAAERDAEAAAADTGSADWEYQSSGWLYATGPAGFMVATGSQDFLEPERGRFIAAHDPAAVLRRIDRDRKTLARHHPFQNLEIVDMPKVGHVTRCAHDKQHWPCPDITDLAEAWGWTEEATHADAPA